MQLVPSLRYAPKNLVTSTFAGSTLSLQVTKVPTVHAPRFPKVKEEGWWLVVGDVKSNVLLCIKRISLLHTAKVKLEFVASSAGEHVYNLYLMSDSYVGCDQELELPLTVAEANEEESGEEEEEEEEDA